jgi:hypothetical protein
MMSARALLSLVVILSGGCQVFKIDAVLILASDPTPGGHRMGL